MSMIKVIPSVKMNMIVSRDSKLRNIEYCIQSSTYKSMKVINDTIMIPLDIVKIVSDVMIININGEDKNVPGTMIFENHFEVWVDENTLNNLFDKSTLKTFLEDTFKDRVWSIKND